MCHAPGRSRIGLWNRHSASTTKNPATAAALGELGPYRPRTPLLGSGPLAANGALDRTVMLAGMSVEAAADWRDRRVSAAEAVSVVRPGDKLFVGSACATPRALGDELEQLMRSGVVLVHFLTDRVARVTRPLRAIDSGAGVCPRTAVFGGKLPVTACNRRAS
jgi:hypothetical protein